MNIRKITENDSQQLLDYFGFESAGLIKNYYKMNDNYIDRVYLTKNI